jgi:acetyl esterase
MFGPGVGMADSLELLEPQTRAFIQAVRATVVPPLSQMTVAELRQSMREGQAWPLDAPDIARTVHTVAGCTTHVLRPAQAQGNLPAIVYLHGGGWVLGGLDTHAHLMQRLVRATGAAVIFPEYSLAPEAHFSVAIEQCYAALQWTAQNAEKLNLDGDRIAIMGDSSGGNLATVVAALAAQRGGPVLKLQVLVCPVTDCDLDRPSYKKFGSGFYLDTELMRWFWDRYLPDAKDRANPLASPLRFRAEDLRAAAPALILTAECDVLHEEGEAYARKLAEAGVPTAAYRCLGTVHSFLLENKLAETPPARSAMQCVVAHLKDALDLSEEGGVCD